MVRADVQSCWCAVLEWSRDPSLPASCMWAQPRATAAARAAGREAQAEQNRSPRGPCSTFSGSLGRIARCGCGGRDGPKSRGRVPDACGDAGTSCCEGVATLCPRRVPWARERAALAGSVTRLPHALASRLAVSRRAMAPAANSGPTTPNTSSAVALKGPRPRDGTVLTTQPPVLGINELFKPARQAHANL